ncbi:MAG: DUF4352 domain-containing protein [Candidatus Sumerlaeaceae bacterium]|nr:DUF4352 domain-containing protein [Candidatus Sumerlaeaceae bacterium]
MERLAELTVAQSHLENKIMLRHGASVIFLLHELALVGINSAMSSKQRLLVAEAVLVAWLFAGCAFLGAQRDRAASSVPQTMESAEITETQTSPFLMAAESSGNIITFAITNNSAREYNVSPYHFALIVQGTRRIVPYSPEIATIDVPSRLGPGETIMGRAIFNEFPAPEGHKLVFKPGQEATFAVITSKFNPLRTIPKTKRPATPTAKR